MEVKVHKPGSLFIQRKATRIAVSTDYLRLVVVARPPVKVRIAAIAIEMIVAHVDVCESRERPEHGHVDPHQLVLAQVQPRESSEVGLFQEIQGRKFIVGEVESLQVWDRLKQFWTQVWQIITP